MTVTWVDFSQALLGAVAVALAVVVAGAVAFRLLGRRWPPARSLSTAVRHPFRALVLVVALNAAVDTVPDTAAEWWHWVEHACRILGIVVTAWFVAAVLLFLEDVSLHRHRVDVPDNRTARRLRTQVLLLRRLTVILVGVVALAAVLLTFPAVKAVGASMLASAGLISIVAGLAAQSTLANVFAGIQLAFSDAIRIDDAVIVEEEWGWVEEITLTYVVVRLWDDRRLILPSTYFSSTPFQNWTRHASELLGAVELDVDWRVDVAGMRTELDRILEHTDLWDGRVKVLQVTDAVGGLVRIRILVTARDAPTLFDLRCFVREQIVAWVQHHNEGGLPRQRTELVEATGLPYRRPRRDTDTQGLFTGDIEAEARAARAGGGTQERG